MDYNPNTYCVMAHRGLFIQPDKKVKPCCVFGNFDEDLYYDSKMSFDDLFNSKQFVELRQQLSQGIKHKGCSGCWSGRTSHREGMNRMYSGDKYNFTPSLKEDDIFYLDVRISNLCNFKCRMCNPTYSSAWNDEVVKHNLPIDTQPTEKIVKESWLTVLENNLDKVDHIYLGGGEPLIMKETYELLDCVDSRKEEIQLFINTNLSTLKYKNKNILERFYEFKNVYWFLSCDGTRQAGTYQRTGFNVDTFYKNLDTILNLPTDKTQYNIAYALTNINIFEFFDTYNDIKSKTGNTDLELNIQVVDNPWYYSVRNNSLEFKKKVLSFIDNNISTISNKHTLLTLQNFKSFINQKSTLPSPKTISKDLKLLQKVDSVRNESLLDIAPWMKKEIQLWQKQLN